MKKWLAVMLALCMMSSAACALAEQTMGDDGSVRESLTAVQLTRFMGNGINLGNTMEACDQTRGNYSDDPLVYETSWGQPVTTQEMLTAMKQAGFDTIRIPVAWMTNATRMPFEMKECVIGEKYIQRVKEIVDYARRVDMYVIINDHWDGGWWGMFGSESLETAAFALEAYKEMWRQIAEAFKDYSDYVIFESANEELGARFDENSPCFCRDSIVSYLPDSQRYALTNQVNQAFVDTVRSTGGNNAHRFLLIAGFGTNIKDTFDSRFVMPADSAKNKLMVSVHYYDPWSYCGATTAAGATRWGRQEDIDAMYKTLSQMSKFVSMGYGVVIGEYGALPGSDGMKENAYAYHKAFLDCCDALDFTSCLWDCSGFFVRKELKIVDEDLAALYAGRNAQSEQGKDYAQIAAAGRQAVQDAISSAPETFLENAMVLTDDTCVAWIMWSSGDWAQSYSVGDVYTPDSVTPGLKPTDVTITDSGEYTVALDFTGTAQGFSNGVAFSAIGISNGERLHSNWCIHITECLINGQPYTLKGRPYTTSDDGICTRTNLFNEWVTSMPADARVLYGPNIGISAQLFDRSDPVFSHIETISVTFRYAPRQ